MELLESLDKHLREIGGNAVRFNQAGDCWTEVAGKVYAARRLEDLAAQFNIYPNKSKEPAMRKTATATTNTDAWINSATAEKISGFSRSLILAKAREGTLDAKTTPRKGRGFLFRRSQVIAWAETQRKLGGSHLPRRRGKGSVVPATNGSEPMQDVSRRPATTAWRKTPTGASRRLQSFLDRLKGTPFETTAEEFTQKVLHAALDKLGA